MGVDFFSCDGCGESICDCGDYVRCECGHRWCDIDCACTNGGYTMEGEDDDGNEMDVESCKYCREEDVEDSTLLNFLLKRHKLTRKKALKLYFDKGKKK